MQFINPLYLFGLFAIAIPIIIHLFNFRKFRKVYFTNVRLLKDLKQQTQKQSRLRYLLILAIRILAIVALVVAFAQPYIPEQKGTQWVANNAVSVFVDNSFSMEAVGKEGTMLDQAKRKAREIVLAYKTSDVFQLLTCDFEGRHQRLVSRDEFLTMLNDLKISPAIRSLDEISRRQYDVLNTQYSSKRSAFIISDFQKTSFYPINFKQDSAINTFLVPVVASTADNVYIDSCWFVQPTQQIGKASVLSARIWNKSDKDLEKIPLKLTINRQQKSLASIDVKAGASVIVELPFTIDKAGIQQGELLITDYPITYDDKFFISFEVIHSIKALAINDKSENQYLKALFAQDSAVVLVNQYEKMLDYSSFSTYDLIILNEIPLVSSGLIQEIKKFVENGGTFLLIPSGNMDVNSYNNLTATLGIPGFQRLDTADSKITTLSEESYLFRDVFEKKSGQKAISYNTDLGKINKCFPFSNISNIPAVPLISMLNGKHLLMQTQVGYGQVFQFAIPFDIAFSDFPRKAIFVPTLYNIALMSHPTQSLYEFIGNDKPIRLRIPELTGEQLYKLSALNNTSEIIPIMQKSGNAINLFPGNLLSIADNYNLLHESTVISSVAFNYNRLESNLECNSGNELNELINGSHLSTYKVLENSSKPMNEVIAKMNNGIQLWRYFIWLTLLLLLTEVLLIRFWKH